MCFFMDGLFGVDKDKFWLKVVNVGVCGCDLLCCDWCYLFVLWCSDCGDMLNV